ncbi:MAG: helix-turn-helix domain-containing protein [Microvirga sp.]|jgi:transcriptional regulator with XRE-family HTH domain
MFVTSAQIRAARALVNWTVRELADRSGVHRNTVTNFESGKTAGDRHKLEAMRKALQAAGVEFIDENGGGPGVRLRKSL